MSTGRVGEKHCTTMLFADTVRVDWRSAHTTRVHGPRSILPVSVPVGVVWCVQQHAVSSAAVGIVRSVRCLSTHGRRAQQADGRQTRRANDCLSREVGNRMTKDPPVHTASRQIWTELNRPLLLQFKYFMKGYTFHVYCKVRSWHSK